MDNIPLTTPTTISSPMKNNHDPRSRPKTGTETKEDGRPTLSCTSHREINRVNRLLCSKMAKSLFLTPSPPPLLSSLPHTPTLSFNPPLASSFQTPFITYLAISTYTRFVVLECLNIVSFDLYIY